MGSVGTIAVSAHNDNANAISGRVIVIAYIKELTVDVYQRIVSEGGPDSLKNWA